jgi:hypothetical protein
VFPAAVAIVASGRASVLRGATSFGRCHLCGACRASDTQRIFFSLHDGESEVTAYRTALHEDVEPVHVQGL